MDKCSQVVETRDCYKERCVEFNQKVLTSLRCKRSFCVLEIIHKISYPLIAFGASRVYFAYILWKLWKVWALHLFHEICYRAANKLNFLVESWDRNSLWPQGGSQDQNGNRMNEGLKQSYVGQGTRGDICVREQIKICLWLASHCLTKPFLTLSTF